MKDKQSKHTMINNNDLTYIHISSLYRSGHEMYSVKPRKFDLRFFEILANSK